MAGKFYGIGVGPGDPELLTLKGQRILAEADCIFAPKTKQEGTSLALQIVADFIGDTPVIEKVMPMTKDKAALAQAWQECAEEVLAYLAEGKQVAFITLGDPSLFSTFMYILNPIKAQNYAWEIVPGINAPSAAAAKLGCGLAEGNESLAIMSAITDLAEVEKSILNHDNTVLMKGAGSWPKIAAILAKHNLTAQTQAVEKCGLPEERVFADIAQMPEDLSYFLTAIIRKGGQA